MFQSRHYVAVANEVGSLFEPPSKPMGCTARESGLYTARDVSIAKHHTWLQITTQLAMLFAADSPSFNIERFINACVPSGDRVTDRQRDDAKVALLLLSAGTDKNG